MPPKVPSIRIAIILLASLPIAAGAQTGIDIREVTGAIELGTHMEILEDPTRALGISELASSERAAAFKPNVATNSNYGYSHSIYWCRFRLDNKGKDSTAFVLELEYPWFDAATLYRATEGGAWLERSASYDSSWKGRIIKAPGMAFPIELGADRAQTFYLKFDGDDLMKLDAKLYPYTDYIAHESRAMVIWGLFFGVLAIMVIYHLFLGAVLKDRSSLFFAGYLAFMAIHRLQHYGLYYLWLPSWLEAIRHNTFYLWTALDNVFGILFTVNFLSVKKHFPRLYPWSFVLLGLLAVQAIGNQFFPTSLSNTFNNILNTLGNIGGLLIVAISLKKTRAAYNYLFSFFPIGLVSLLGFVVSLAFPSTERSFLESYGFDISLIVTVVAMSLSLADRYRSIRRARDSAEAYNLAQTNFFINLSHEIKTPLMLISSSFDDFLADRGDEESLRVAKRNIDRLSDDIVSFFDQLKHEKGLPIYRHDRVVDLSSLLEDKVGLFGTFAAKRGLKTEASLAPGLALRADPLAIERIVNNLLDNAAKYCAEGGTVRVSASRSGNNIEFTISNEAEPLTRDELSHLFDPYFQASRHRSGARGIGLGLSLVKAVAESIGGGASAAMREGGRLEIRLSLPAVAGADANAEAGSPPERPFIGETVLIAAGAESSSREDEPSGPRVPGETGGRVLLVEDDEELRRLLAKKLEADYEVESVASGEAAMEALAGPRLPDVVVSDIMLPRMDGVELLTAMGEELRLRDIPVVLMTARTGIEEKLRALNLGAVDCIFKPFRVEELQSRIEGLMRLRLLQRELRGNERLASLGLLAGAVCHEVLNPLSIILSALANASAIIDEGAPESLARIPVFLGYAEQSAARIGRTVRALRSSFAEGEGPEPEELPLRGLLEPLANEARRGISNAARVELDCPEALRIRTDGVAFSAAIACLMDNAAKSLRGSAGILRIQARAGERAPEILIEDSGCGMPPERLRAIRERVSAASGSEGMGFGILLAGELLGRLGYRLEFESEVGKGTRVRAKALTRHQR
jgi:signal transduction histidine kinase